jgi:hypothetical protein
MYSDQSLGQAQYCEGNSHGPFLFLLLHLFIYSFFGSIMQALTMSDEEAKSRWLVS